MQMNLYNKSASKKAANLSINSDLLQKANSFHLETGIAFIGGGLTNMIKNSFFRKTKEPGDRFKAVYFIMASIFALMLFSCATPQVAVNPDATKTDYTEYEIVYLHTPDSTEDDPRNVFPQVIEGLEDLGFQVYPVNQDNPMQGAQGTGFIIDQKGYVLTCAHIFKDENQASLWIDGTRHLADLVYTDKENDLALLKMNISQQLALQPLPISRDPEYKMGQDVYTIGFPLSDMLGNSPRLNKGLISSTVGLKDNPGQLQISVEIQPGNSGSPLLNKNGVVVGIVQSTLDPMNVMARTGGNLPQNVNFAAKSKIIRDFIGKSGANVNLLMDSAEKVEFDHVSESVVQIRAGDITEEFLKKPKLFCQVAYQSIWDFWYRFRIFHVEFYDLETGELLLKAGQYGDNPISTESKVIDATFEQIKAHFRAEK